MTAEKETLTSDGNTSWYDLNDSGMTIFIGDSDGSNFGGGTLSIDYTADDGDNSIYSTDSTTYTATNVLNIKPEANGLKVRARLASSTSPDLNITFFIS